MEARNGGTEVGLARSELSLAFGGTFGGLLPGSLSCNFLLGSFLPLSRWFWPFSARDVV